MDNILVIGGGSWGTAFANYLAQHGKKIRLWVRERELIEAIETQRENRVFLPGVRLAENLKPVFDLAREVPAADMLIFAVPSKFLRAIFIQLRDIGPGKQVLVNLAKGFEFDSLKTASQVAEEVLGAKALQRWVTLSGPSFATELSRQHPTAVVGASLHSATLRRIQKDFSSPILRIYRSEDIRGVEVGGALKNVIAIASGMASGLGFGYNTTASLVTRASMEIARLGAIMGAKPETFWGLAGIGDLMLTCFGPLSRNFQLGRQIAQGKTLKEVEAASPMIAEGVETTRAVWAICAKTGIDMPICGEVYRVLYEDKKPEAAIHDLMTRSLKAEWNSK